MADIYVNNQLVKRIDTYGPSRKLRQILFETDTLPYGQHIVKIVNKGNGDRRAIGVDVLVYLDNHEKGAFQIEYGNDNVSEGKEILLKLNELEELQELLMWILK